MTQVSVEEIQRDVSAFLQRVEAGDDVAHCADWATDCRDQTSRCTSSGVAPVWIMRGRVHGARQDFDAPLPEDIINTFEGT